MSSCAAVTDLGIVRNVLLSVDCNTKNFARLGYESFTRQGSSFQVALTAALTIYVAVIGYRLLFGNGARLSDGPAIAFKIGAVLALVSSWSLFQTLVFDVAERAPLEIAALISAPERAGALSADPIAGLQTSYDQLTAAAATFAHPAKGVPDTAQNDYVTAAQALNLAANSLFVASAGLIAVITIAIGLLTATGPLFIALFLFFETRGFFVGWVRALMACAFGLLSAWSLTVLMLHAVQPWMAALATVSGGGVADARTGITTAIIILVYCAAQFGLLLAGIMIARGFHLPSQARSEAVPAAAGQSAAATLPLDMISRPALLAEQLGRRDAPSAYTERAAATAAGVASGRRDSAAAAAASPRGGVLYRRPAVSRGGRA